jgi:hypothetical protein
MQEAAAKAAAEADERRRQDEERRRQDEEAKQERYRALARQRREAAEAAEAAERQRLAAEEAARLAQRAAEEAARLPHQTVLAHFHARQEAKSADVRRRAHLRQCVRAAIVIQRAWRRYAAGAAARRAHARLHAGTKQPHGSSGARGQIAGRRVVGSSSKVAEKPADKRDREKGGKVLPAVKKRPAPTLALRKEEAAREIAALTIQLHWRRYLQRKAARQPKGSRRTGTGPEGPVLKADESRRLRAHMIYTQSIQKPTVVLREYLPLSAAVTVGFGRVGVCVFVCLFVSFRFVFCCVFFFLFCFSVYFFLIRSYRISLFF